MGAPRAWTTWAPRGDWWRRLGTERCVYCLDPVRLPEGWLYGVCDPCEKVRGSGARVAAHDAGCAVTPRGWSWATRWAWMLKLHDLNRCAYCIEWFKPSHTWTMICHKCGTASIGDYKTWRREMVGWRSWL